MWFDVEAVPLSFTRSSPYHIENTTSIEASAARVFEIIATGERQKDWFVDFVACRWTSPEPRGVGAEREVQLKLLTVKERFLAWDEGKRLSFHIHGITLPFVKAMLEDMVIESTGERTCRVTWTVHYRPSLLMKLGHPIGRAIFGRMFRGSIQGLARYAAAHPTAAG
jgi:uncharacterized protein YndB with AHSA1/START domain